MAFKMALVFRRDLKLSKGKLAVQAAHAAVTCAQRAKKKHTDWFSRWYGNAQMKIALKVDDLDELLELESLVEDKFSTALIRDAGRTEVAPGTITCLAIGPAPEEILDKYTGELALL